MKRSRRPWHDDDRFWAAAAPILFRRDRQARAPAEVRAVLRLLGLRRGARVLDMPCGHGRHSLELLRRGLRVTAVDRARRYIAAARRAGRAFGKRARWVCADMREFAADSEFDGVVNLWTSFGYFEDPADDERVARNFVGSLKPGGRLVMDLMGKEVLARVFKAENIRAHDSGLILIERARVVRDWTRVESTWIVVRGGRRRELAFSLRLYSAAELRALLERVGFEDVRALGSLEGTPYDHEAKRLVVVARKPGTRRPTMRGAPR